MNKAFEIVFDDEYLIVAEKKAKILIQPSPKSEKHTLSSILEKDIGARVFPCHRLDRETTGLIIYAKSSQIQAKIMEQFRQGKVRKKYIAFVNGRLRKKKGLLEDYIIDRQGKIFGEKPKKAKTIYKVWEAFYNWSAVELLPLTGRTNQLRIQMAKLGHPVLGEDKYALRRDFKVKFRRLALHAFYLSFIHPVSNERVSLKIDLASDMKKFLCAAKSDL